LEPQDFDIIIDLLRPLAGAGGYAPESERVRDFASRTAAPLIDEALKHFERCSARGDAVAASILSLASPARSGIADGEDRAIANESRLEEDDPASSLLVELAAQAFDASRINEAAAYLAALQYLGLNEAEALSGLALCAARLGQFDEALFLAQECLKLPEKHPRAYCVAGYCELEKGRRKDAQAHLAMAARLARSRPEFKRDLQAAQRLLLILHYS
jgi:Flp pilus assembly protein TadD